MGVFFGFGGNVLSTLFEVWLEFGREESEKDEGGSLGNANTRQALTTEAVTANTIFHDDFNLTEDKLVGERKMPPLQVSISSSWKALP